MKKMVLVGIVSLVLLLVVGLVFTTNNVKANEKTISCSSCGNSCTAENNCGLESCGATQGKTCGCSRNGA